MAEEAIVVSYCLNEEGFPKLLRDTTVRLGISEHPEYEGREYEECGTEHCVVTIRVGRSGEFPDIGAWRVTTTGFRLADTYQAAARKALWYLCQLYEGPIARTPMRLFPPLLRESPIWQSRMQTLEGRTLLEDDPTVVFMTWYLLALDERYDQLARRLKRCICRAEEAEVQVRQLRM